MVKLEDCMIGGVKNNDIKTEKFKSIEVGSTFYLVEDYGRINQYEKTSDGFGEEIMTASSNWFDDEVTVYTD
jgi:hypothetical protein